MLPRGLILVAVVWCDVRSVGASDGDGGPVVATDGNGVGITVGGDVKGSVGYVDDESVGA